MIWLLVCYIVMICFNFWMSIDYIAEWAYRENEAPMHKIVRWISLFLVNPIFVIFFGIALYLYRREKRIEIEKEWWKEYD